MQLIMKMTIKMKMIMNRNNNMTRYIHQTKQLAGTASNRLRHCLTLLVLLMGTATVWDKLHIPIIASMLTAKDT